ncbi:LysE/ArgO family amino acid transporter [Leuconostoc sp. JNUCC 76]
MLVILKGLLIGFGFIAPIGMQNVFMFNNALSNRFTKAVFVAAMIWIADASFALSAFWGFGALIMSANWLKITIMLAGGALVIWIGINIIKTACQVKIGSSGKTLSFSKSILTAFLVVWGNPQAIIDGALMLGAFRSTLSINDAFLFIFGVILASALWFFSITIIVNILRHKISNKVLIAVNFISGMVVVIYGIYIFVHGLQQLI